jgi:hypothetical protein
MVFHDLTTEQKSKWQKKAAPLMAKWVEFMNERGLPGTEAQNMFIKLRDKYAKQIAQKGYPWESK